MKNMVLRAKTHMGRPAFGGFVIKALLEQFKAAQSLPHIPVIFITSPVDSVRDAAYPAAGAADFVTTPVNPDLLHARVGTQLLLKLQSVQSDQLLAMDFHDGLTGVCSRH